MMGLCSADTNIPSKSVRIYLYIIYIRSYLDELNPVVNGDVGPEAGQVGGVDLEEMELGFQCTVQR